MPRILGVDIPSNKRLETALTAIYGVGRTRAAEICHRTRLDPGLRAGELTDGDISAIAQLLQDHFVVEGDLRRQIAQNIRRLTAIGCYRGMRHRRGLPVRGQRTKTNARTRKGSKKTVGAIRDKTARKLARTGGR
ncbi:MAG: 30S ribosomal protein S13 [Kiritimatiellaeota bacterium]|nr:30S ribosomal protein S13 [Kiritimatiellota bacterium]